MEKNENIYYYVLENKKYFSERNIKQSDKQKHILVFLYVCISANIYLYV